MNSKNDNVQTTMDLSETSETETIKKAPEKKTAKKASAKTTAKKVAAKKTTTKKAATKKDNTTKEKKEVEKKETSKKKTSTVKSANSTEASFKKTSATVKSSKKAEVETTSATSDKKVSTKPKTKKKTEDKKASTPPKKKSNTTKSKPADSKEKIEMNEETQGVTINHMEEREAVETSPTEDSVNVSNATVSEPLIEDIKRFKLFFVSDMDEEASYLHDMSLQGYHFVNKKGMQYHFKQGEPINYFYHLGYYEKDKRDGDRYLDNYIEAGWENIFHEKAEFDGVWNYFRIEMPTGVEEPNIFSDRVSRLALYKRLLSSWRSLLAVNIICFICMIAVYIFLSNTPGTLTGIAMTICTILGVLIVVTFVIYLRAYMKISKKQQELQNI